MVSVSEKAVEKIREMMDSEGKKNARLRLMASPGGCDGAMFEMVFDDNVSASDNKENFHGIQVVYAKGVEGFVGELEIDYIESLNQSGFTLKNPKATHTCGCGKSQGF